MSIDKKDVIKSMLINVAEALGSDLLDSVAFLGGCATGLHVTDAATMNDIRMTDDVDLVVSAVGYSAWSTLQKTLRSRGFKENMNASYTCSMQLGELQVDFLPDDEAALGFTCQWYKEGLVHAIKYPLTESIYIKLLNAPYFIATKIDAYYGRGNNDLLASKDIQDIFSVIDGREELTLEVQQSDPSLQLFIAENLLKFNQQNDFDYVIQAATNGDRGREHVIRERIDVLLRVLP